MKDILQTIRPTVTEEQQDQMAMYMKAIGLTTKLMALVKNFGKMVQNLKVKIFLILFLNSFFLNFKNLINSPFLYFQKN